MLSRSYGEVAPFDQSVAQLHEHFRLLLEYSQHRYEEAQ